MKKTLFATFTTTLLLGLSVLPLETDASAKTFKNCTELNKVYKGGVAKNDKVKNKGGKTKYTPTVSAKLYAANATKDRDSDGIACER
ncbi:excalibur calcium-binding domain-containing protein [Viridibacillus sp. YIM B01967]|uniref:Excalibur calcium-binding domain-containing protein n=1 Tax=Viridibacillus soli TaxID=2798301 RepID=A0ABS1H1L4_9BACL|nr:excalibur calcium-binding domain-containing protein [Viridibacillus soli]MBK3493300.1 excalibur calcium-binding domain-containing protein [Viridibacillus soli]